MRNVLRWRLAALVSLSLALPFACGGEDDCSGGCKKVYDECKLALLDGQGAPYSKDQCLQVCAQTPQSKAVLACIHKISGCDETAMSACINNTGTAPPMKHPYTPPPLCLSCHGAGTSSNAKKVPASHSGRANESCPTCHPAGS